MSTYNLAKTPLKAAQAPLATAYTSHEVLLAMSMCFALVGIESYVGAVEASSGSSPWARLVSIKSRESVVVVTGTRRLIMMGVADGRVWGSLSQDRSESGLSCFSSLAKNEIDLAEEMEVDTGVSSALPILPKQTCGAKPQSP